MTGNVHALVGAYVVDALDDAERVAFEAHLATCSDCQAEIASLSDTASLLTSLSATAPPSGLRDRVLADAARTRPLPPAVPRTPTAERDLAPNVRRLPRPTRRLTILAAAAAVLAAVGIGAGVTQPWDNEPDLSATERVLQAPDAKSVTVELDGGAKATVVRSLKEDRAVIVTHDMPPAPVGRVYQLWLQDPDGPYVSAGLMPPGSDQTRLLEGNASTAVGAGITIEPEGGSKEPTTNPIALFDLTAAT
ncbi:anti-sigma factor [Nocardioides speluncae]|uniref:anti-sigma factor n=1 Tax=Nocardioides speluncae TaxID=2670337 RepID=UPI000D68B0A0|nr:anti-sigma factor [Nocardioides speluncae]